MSRAHAHGLLIGLGAALLALLLWFAQALEGWERTTWTWRLKLLAKPGPTTEEIVVVLLDQPSLDWGERENGLSVPWPREVYAPLIDFCVRGGAKVIAFDLLFTEPSIYGVWDDQNLGEAIARSDRFVGAQQLKIESGGLAATGLTEAIPEVREAARGMGNVADLPDADGVFRRAGLLREWQGELVPSLGTAAWLIGAGLEVEKAIESLVALVPLTEDGTALLRYRGPASVYTSYSAAAVIQSELRLLEKGEPTLDPEIFRDKYVFFGTSAPGLLDLRPTPLSRVTPGVIIHATALDNLLSGDFMRRAPAGAVLIGNLLLGALAGLWTVSIRRARNTILAGLLLLTLPALIGLATYAPGWWWPILPGEIAVGLALFGAVARNYSVEGRQRRFINQAFRHYLSPAVIEKILADPKALRLGGERRELTILFSDLAGFTSLSEGLDAETLTTLLNDYLSDMTDIILDEGGTLDKYEGDAIIAFWNAPLTQNDHAERACRAAIRAQQRLAERRPEFRERCGRDLNMRIGLHTGEVIVGNMGSRQRFDYTVLGDAANLASRLEGANKVFGSGVMVSQATLDQGCGAITSRELGTIRVVGRQEAVLVHELIDLAGAPLPTYCGRFGEGLELCRGGELERAAEIFAIQSDDPPSAAYLERCREALASGELFAGEWNLTSK